MVNQTSRLLNSLSFPFLPTCRNFSNRLSSLSLSFLCETLTDIAAVTNSAAVFLSLSLLYFFFVGGEPSANISSRELLHSFWLNATHIMNLNMKPVQITRIHHIQSKSLIIRSSQQKIFTNNTCRHYTMSRGSRFRPNFIPPRRSQPRSQ